MRRISLAVFPLVLAALVIVYTPVSHLSAQSQDPTIASARTLLEQGSHDAAITLLRDALTTRRADAALRQALIEALGQKRESLTEQARALGDEIAALRAVPAVQACDGRAPVRVGGTIQAPQRTNEVRAAYPAEALDQKIEGVSVIEVVIDCTGAVSDAQVLRGNPVLNAAALDAVRQWRYRPTLLNGVPVPVVMTVTVSFTLRY
jgi:TonB family protein